MYRCKRTHLDTSFGLPGHVYANFSVMYGTGGTPSQHQLKDCLSPILKFKCIAML